MVQVGTDPIHFTNTKTTLPCVVPVTQVALEGEEVLVEALDGLLLQDIVDAVTPVQLPHLHLGLLLPQRLHRLRHLVLCDRRGTTVR